MRSKKSLITVSCLTVLGLLLASCAPAAPPVAATAKPAAPPQAPAAAPTQAPAAAATPKPAAPTPSSKTAAQPRHGGSVTRIVDGYPEVMDPHLRRGAAIGNEVLGPLYNALFMINENLEIVPDLVEKWEQPDDVTYVLHLREGITFHDTPTMKGREFTAEDVKYNVQRMSTNDPRFFSRWKFQLVSRIEVVDKLTVRLTLSGPTAPFMYFMAEPPNYMVGKDAVDRSGDLAREEAGTGPFYLKSWAEKVTYKLAKYPKYFVKGIPYFDEVNVIFVPDPASRIAAFRSGRADYALVSYNDVVSLKRTNPNITSSVIPTDQVFMAFHPDKKPFDDQRVRQAFSLAINRQALIDIAMEGQAELTGAIYGVASSWRLPAEELKQLYKPDIPRAKALMADAGFPNGFPLEVKISSQRRDAVESANVLAQQLKQIGVEVKQQVLEHTVVVAQRNAADYLALLHGGGATVEPGERIEQYWRPGGMYHLKDQQLANLIDEQRRTVDVARRRQILNQFERLAIEKAYFLMLFGYGSYLVSQPRVKGPQQPSVIGHHLIAYNWLGG